MNKIDKHLQTIGKKTFVMCFETAGRAAKRGGITPEQVARCDADSQYWKDNTLSIKKSVIRRIFKDGNQCRALKKCFTILGNPAAAAKAKKLHSRHCAPKKRA